MMHLACMSSVISENLVSNKFEQPAFYNTMPHIQGTFHWQGHSGHICPRPNMEPLEELLFGIAMSCNKCLLLSLDTNMKHFQHLSN